MDPKINNNLDSPSPLVDEHAPPTDVQARAGFNRRKVSIPDKNNTLDPSIVESIKKNLLNKVDDSVLEPKQIDEYSIKKSLTHNFVNRVKNFLFGRKHKYKPKKKVLVCLTENLQAMAKRFSGKEAVRVFDFEVGCCFGIASNYVLFHKLGKPKEFKELLTLLSSDPKKGWRFYGTHYKDLGKAIEKAQKEYKKNPNTKNSDTLILLKLRPFAESLLFFQSPRDTVFGSTIPFQNTQQVANVLEGDVDVSNLFESTRNYDLALTREGLTDLLINLGDTVKSGEAERIFHFSSGRHILSCKVSADGYELCDQNIDGFTQHFPKGEEIKLSSSLNNKLNQAGDVATTYNPIFSICEFDITNDENSGQVFCLPDIIDKIPKENRCSVGESNQAGMTVVHLAATEGNLEELQKIYGSSTVPPIIDQRYNVETPLQRAAYFGHTKVVEFLLANGHDIQEEGSGLGTPLICALQSNRTQTAQLLLGACDTVADQPDKFGQTPLFLASHNNNIEMMAKLLETKSVNINHQALNEATPLFEACYNGHIEAVKLLLAQNGIRLDININGKTVLQWAQERGYEEIVQLLKVASER